MYVRSPYQYNSFIQYSIIETSGGNLCLIESLFWYRRVLTIGCAMLISSCRCYVKHPDLETARSNRDFSFEVILEASTTISRVRVSDNNHVH